MWKGGEGTRENSVQSEITTRKNAKAGQRRYDANDRSITAAFTIRGYPTEAHTPYKDNHLSRKMSQRVLDVHTPRSTPLLKATTYIFPRITLDCGRGNINIPNGSETRIQQVDSSGDDYQLSSVSKKLIVRGGEQRKE